MTPTGPAPEGLTIAETIRDGARRLAAAGIENPRLEARLLLAHALNLRSEDIVRELSAQAGPSNFDSLVIRRSAHEPMAYILGWREFWSLRFRVSPATLIPRPESESLVEAALALCPDSRAESCVLDLGTGTGCLLLAFLHQRPGAFGVGIDRSEVAVRVARGNAVDLGLAARSAFARGDWADSVGATFDLILSNPPYIATSDLAGLMPDVREFEPRSALDGGSGGLAAYRAIMACLPRLLRPKGAAILELGAGQFASVAALAGRSGLRSEAHFDLSGVARAIILRPGP